MTRISPDTLYGTLNLLILRSLQDGWYHGLELRRRIRAASADALRVEEGAMYPALHRLEKDGLLRSEWRISEKKRRAKYYTLTTRGRHRLERELRRWEAHVAAVGMVMGGGPAER